VRDGDDSPPLDARIILNGPKVSRAGRWQCLCTMGAKISQNASFFATMTADPRFLQLPATVVSYRFLGQAASRRRRNRNVWLPRPAGRGVDGEAPKAKEPIFFPKRYWEWKFRRLSPFVPFVGEPAKQRTRLSPFPIFLTMRIFRTRHLTVLTA